MSKRQHHVSSPTLAAFLEDWLPTYEAKGLRDSPIRAFKKNLRVHLVPHFGDTPLDKIDRQALDKFVAAMFTKTKGKNAADRTSRNGYLDEPKRLSAKTVKHALSTLRGVLATAVEWNVLPALPRFPKVKVDAVGSTDFYNVEETELLLAGARDEDERLWLLFALHTGARAGEQLAVEYGDLDFHAGRVDLHRSRSEGVLQATPKSRKGRSVPLSDPLAAALKARRHLKGDLVFCQADGSPLTLFLLHGALIRAARKAGLRRLRWHDLRHSFASNLTKNGTPLKQVQEWMGHSTITMTMRYAHLAPHGGREHLAGLTSSSAAASSASRTR